MCVYMCVKAKNSIRRVNYCNHCVYVDVTSQIFCIHTHYILVEKYFN